MAEIIISGETFKIKGDAPTQQEQIAIDSVLAAKKSSDGGLKFDQEAELMITPADVLSETQKGKYNKDTESFLASPTFMRIVTEVGLSIAGGIAGAAAAPFTGGASLAATGLMAARVARLARPLLNASVGKQKLFGAIAGAGVGGGTGAAIAQTFDPRESIVREIARGAAQGAGGEVLGFGLAKGLSGIYNKVTTSSIKQIRGARESVATLTRDTAFNKALKKIKDGKGVTEEEINILKIGTKDEAGKVIAAGITDEQVLILRSPKLSKEAIERAGDLLDETKNLVGKGSIIRAEKANITPGKLTENNAIDTLSGMAQASIIGGGVMRTSEGVAARQTIAGIENFVEATLSTLPKQVGYDEAGIAIGKLINEQVTQGNQVYLQTVSKLYGDVGEAIQKNLMRADGTFDPAYDVVFRGPGVAKKMDVLRTPKMGDDFVEKGVSNLEDYMRSASFNNRTIKDPVIDKMVGMIQSTGGRTDYANFQRMYSAIGAEIQTTTSAPIQANLLARMQVMLNNSPLPGGIGQLRDKASKFTNLGAAPFRKGVLKSMMGKERGHEAIYKQIIASGKESYYDDFFRLIDKGQVKFTVGGKKFSKDIFAGNKDLMKDALRGQFFKDFLENSVDTAGQYPKLLNSKASKFLKQHEFMLKKPGFLTASQITGIREYTKKIQLVEGTLKPAGASGSNPAMFVQLNQAGAMAQVVGVLGGGTGVIDPGTALFFVAAPYGLARAFSSPKATRILMEGLGGKSMGSQRIDSMAKLTRYIGQLSTALVGAGAIGPEEAQETMSQLEGNAEYFKTYFETGKFTMPPAREFNPEKAPALGFDPEEVVTEETETVVERPAPKLPNVTPGNVGSTGINPQARMALASGNIDGALAANSMGRMKTGGIVSVFKKN